MESRLRQASRLGAHVTALLCSLAGFLLLTIIGSRSGQARPRMSTTVEIAPAARQQVIDGFGACIGNDLGKDPAFQALYFDELGASIVRMDLTPRFVSPYSDLNYVSPWFYNSASSLTFPPG